MKDEYKEIAAYQSEWFTPITDNLFIWPYIKHLEKETTNGIVARGMEQVDFNKSCFFMTNHRDITLDPSFLSYLLNKHHINRPYIGIGNNLFGKWWIEPLVRYNKAFVVIRDGGLKDLVKNSQRLSEYIHYLQIEKQANIWMAQREGRAKDSNDRTQPAVLKMLTMAGEGNFIERVKSLNICPVCISYEYDPCDYLKAWEMQMKRDHSDYKKTRENDILNMATGIKGFKGKVVFTFTPSINDELDAIAEKTSIRNEQLQMVAELIDRRLHKNYYIFERDEKEFANYIQSRLDKIEIENKDEDFLRAKLIEMYQNPVINHKKAIEEATL